MVTKVCADVHEQRSDVYSLLEADPEIELETIALRAGDYLIANRVLVERKSASDFCRSLQSYRIFHQSYRMQRRRDVVSLVVVEGRGGLRSPRQLGAQLTLALVYGVPTIAVDGPTEFVWLIKHIDELVRREGRKPTHVAVLPRTRNTMQRAQNVLGQLPGIGSAKSRNLLRHFGSLRRVLLASEIELARVNGIGSKLAKRVAELLDFEWKNTLPRA